MLTKCVNCGFYIRQTDEFCLNCGIKNPNETLKKNKRHKSLLRKIFRSNNFLVFFSLFLTFIFIYILADRTIENFLYLRNYIWFSALIFWLVLFFSLFLILKTFNVNKTVPHVIKYKNNLNSKTKIIDKRIAELNSRRHKIDAVLDKFRETDGKNLQEVRQKLLSAREIVMSQFARYELQRKKIELVRLQNGVSPYLFSLHRLNEFETEDGLVTIENAQTEINQIRQNLTNYVAIEFPRKVLPERENFLAQLAETEISCEKLREALLSRQAARALQDISPIEENLKLPSAKEIVHAAESFNIQTTLTDFSESFEELEHEYKRLRAEEETGQKLLES
jgi:hypothetical protein